MRPASKTGQTPPNEATTRQTGQVPCGEGAPNNIFALDAANDREQSLQDKAIDKIQDIYDARRTRVDLVNAGIPDFLWYSLIGGAVLVVLFPLLTRPHVTGRLLVAVGIQGAVIVGALYLVTVLNRPCSGAYRVEPDTFEILVSRLNPSP